MARELNLPKADGAMPWPSAWDSPIIGLASLAAAVGLLLWFDNVHLVTTNGLWKVVDVEPWKTSSADSQLYSANYLYAPVMGLLCRLLDHVHIFAGQTFRQLALINTAFAAISVVIMHRLVRGLTGRRDLAAMAALFQFSCGFFLMLAITNEDIMPSFTFMLAAMAAAALWFGAPSVRQVMVVAILFTAGMLGEWRLLFPILPALLLALALSEGRPSRRLGLIAVFLVTVVATCLVVLNRTEGHAGAVGLPGILWTGKGMNTGWGGFSVNKLTLLAVGVGEYWWGGKNITDAGTVALYKSEWLSSAVMQGLLLALFAHFLCRHRTNERWRATAIMFLGTFVAGEVMNAYSQPQDPQMQINVMPWLTLAWTVALAGQIANRALFYVVATLSVAPLFYSIVAHDGQRGADSRTLASLAAIERQVDLARTVFVYSGFEGIVTWKYVLWTKRWEGVCDLGPAPQATPKFKWISLYGSSVNHPDWTPEQHAAALREQLDCALSRGYRLMATEVWNASAEELIRRMVTIAGRKTAAAMHAVMQDGFDSRPAFDSGEAGIYSAITPKPR